MEFVTELSKDVISTLGKLAVLSTMKQFGYVIHHKNIISKLKEEHGKLKGVKEAMQAWVDTKKMNREGIEPNIQNWLNDMEAFENVLQRTFSEEEVKKNEKCFGGKCPNLANNYSLGKRAAKGIEYIARLKEEKKEFLFISYHKPPPTVGSTFTEGIKSLKSRMMIMNQVSRECGSLPLAIVIVGKALKNEKKLSTWEVALEQLKNSQTSTFSDVHKFVYSRIELSLNFLGSIHKKFLMLCGLFPEDFDIPIESLSRHATGLGLFKVDGDTWKTINQVHRLVDDLKRCCLLLDSNVPGCVKMHDIVRDVVILVTFKTDEHRQFMVEHDMKMLGEEKLNDINAISLILDDETIGLEDKLECPTLQLLQLQSKRKEPTQWPKSFFQGMKSLKVLSLQSLYIPKFSTLSQASVSLHTLQVEYCDVGDISIIDTTVYCNGFPNIRSLSLKNLPNFKEMCCTSNNGELNSSHWMQLFPKLETILLQNCSSINVVFDTQVNGQVFPQLKEIEIARLNQLTHVWRSNKAMHFVQGFQNLKILTISYCDSLRHVFNLSIIGAITNIEELNIKCCKLMEYLVSDEEEEEGRGGGHKNKEKENTVSFEKLYSLTLSGLPSIARVCTNSYEIQFPSLRKLEIDDCPKLDILVFLTTSHSSIEEDTSFNNCEGNNSRSSNWQFGCTPFCSKKINKTCSTSERRTKIEFKGAPLLQELNVKNCDLHQCLVIDSFLYSNLKSLTVRGCDRISVLLSFPSMRCLEQLEKLDITECKNLFEIVCQEESEANGEKIIIFPALQDLILQDLPKLKAFFHGPYKLDFPSLQKVSICNCPDMEVFSRGVSSMPELKDVNIRNGTFSTNSIHKDDINVTIQQFFKTFVELQKCEMLNFKELLDKGMFGYFIRQKEMQIISFQRLSMLVPFSEIKMLQHVRKLFLGWCDELIEVFESVTEKRDDITHYQLQEMTLYKLPRLSRMWNHNNIEVVSFKNLTKLKVFDCDNLKSLLSYSMARSLVQLQTIEVSMCEMMEEIITKGEKYMEGDNRVKTLLPKLEELRLVYLRKLEWVCSVDYDYDIPFFTDEEDNKFNNNDKVQILFPELKKLSFSEVPKLKGFCSGVYTYDIRFLSVVNTPNLHRLSWDSMNMHTYGDLNLTIYYYQNQKKFMAALQKLKTFRNIVDKELIGYIKRVTSLDIVNCHNLLSCIPSNMMQLFSHLNTLIVKECDCLEEIFETNDYMLQCELSFLRLFSLPKLKHIWKNQGGQIVGFKCLERISIDGCNDLEHVFPDVSVVTSLPNLYTISVYNCEKMKKIIGNNCNPINYLGHNAKIKFPKSLNDIALVRLPSLECFGQSNFPCYVEMSNCKRIWIQDCPKMKTFWHDGILYTPNLDRICVDVRYKFKNEDVNEVIQRYYK
ncbi:putative disease resistance protein [Trifolium repens]|nr:putative disease resistance protein [Trifolium repens]